MKAKIKYQTKEAKILKEKESKKEIHEEVQEETEILALKEELEEQKEKFLRLAAEYENFRKRSEKEKEAIYKDATRHTILCILPIIDSFDMAEKTFENLEGEHKKGFEMIKCQMKSALKAMNTESFGEIGEEFKPEFHGAISHNCDETTDKKNFISAVFQKGYKIGEKIIRHAMVQVTN